MATFRFEMLNFDYSVIASETKKTKHTQKKKHKKKFPKQETPTKQRLRFQVSRQHNAAFQKSLLQAWRTSCSSRQLREVALGDVAETDNMTARSDDTLCIHGCKRAEQAGARLREIALGDVVEADEADLARLVHDVKIEHVALPCSISPVERLQLTCTSHSQSIHSTSVTGQMQSRCHRQVRQRSRLSTCFEKLLSLQARRSARMHRQWIRKQRNKKHTFHGAAALDCEAADVCVDVANGHDGAGVGVARRRAPVVTVVRRHLLRRRTVATL